MSLLGLIRSKTVRVIPCLKVCACAGDAIDILTNQTSRRHYLEATVHSIEGIKLLVSSYRTDCSNTFNKVETI